MSVVTPFEPKEPTSMRLATPMAMLDRAIEQGAGIEVVSKIMDLEERHEKSQARKAFSEAFAAFKSEAIAIVRNKKVTDGPLKGKSYAELFSVVEAVTPALSKHGLSASWAITRDEKDWIEVTCTIEHVLGHVKNVSMGGPPDTGGAKNLIQARGSTVTYLERITLKAACGLAEQGDDTDGNGAAPPNQLILDAQVDRLRDLIEETGSDPVKLCAFFKIGDIADLTQAEFAKAVKMLEAKRSRA